MLPMPAAVLARQGMENLVTHIYVIEQVRTEISKSGLSRLRVRTSETIRDTR